MEAKKFFEWVYDLGAEKAAPDDRIAVRLLNERMVNDILCGMVFSSIYVIIGAWQLLSVSLSLALLGPLAIFLNSIGWHRGARILVPVSFGLCIAVTNIVFGSWTDVEMLYFAGLTCVFANFKENEKKEIGLSIFVMTALTVGTHVWAQFHEPIFDVAAKYRTLIQSIVWAASAMLLVSQLKIFLEFVRRSQIALKESEEIYSAVFEETATGLTIVDAQGRFIKANPEMCRLVGYSAEELIGKRVLELSGDDDLAKTSTDIARLQRREVETLSKEKLYRHKSGRFVTTHLKSRPLYHENGDLKYFISSVQDLTEVKETQQKLIHASKMSSLGEMAGAIAHEINTPLAIIQLSAEQLESSQTPQDILRSVEMITSTVTRVASIVKGLKAFARNADHDPLKQTLLEDVVEETLVLCRERFRSRGISLNVDIPRDVLISCRPVQISQVLLNLLNNAIDAVEPVKHRWVRLDAHVSSTGLALRVADSGPGIPSAIRRRILDPFFTTKPLGQGTGLGLSLSKGIAEAHGGRLYLDETQANTTFVVEIPKERVQNVA